MTVCVTLPAILANAFKAVAEQPSYYVPDYVPASVAQITHDCCRHGGFTWQEVHQDAHPWEFGDSGSVVEMDKDEEPMDHILLQYGRRLDLRRRIPVNSSGKMAVRDYNVNWRELPILEPLVMDKIVCLSLVTLGVADG
ncbi:hypothetical protein BYT27DRAFT_7218357 [Phlegmacium glaucopus]|nr:hypothetical protein BYT27DRAFT_7218357 [Phlegmacium glaucopus]